MLHLPLLRYRCERNAITFPPNDCFLCVIYLLARIYDIPFAAVISGQCNLKTLMKFEVHCSSDTVS